MSECQRGKGQWGNEQRVFLTKWVFLTFCLLFSQNTLADNASGRHWSEGVYFPAHTVLNQQARHDYVTSAQADRKLMVSSVGNRKYNPWSVQKGSNHWQRRSDYAPTETRRHDSDPRKRTTQGGQSAPVKGGAYASYHPSEFAAAEYYSGHPRQELDSPASRLDHQTSAYGRDFYSRPYVPRDRRDRYFSHSNSTNKSRLIQRQNNHSQGSSYDAMLGYPRQDYDPYEGSARGAQQISIDRTLSERHPGGFAAATYYSGRPRYGSDLPPYRSEYQLSDADRTYDSQPYLPDYAIESYLPYHEFTIFPWTGLNPFLLNGMASPYLLY